MRRNSRAEHGTRIVMTRSMRPCFSCPPPLNPQTSWGIPATSCESTFSTGCPRGFLCVPMIWTRNSPHPLPLLSTQAVIRLKLKHACTAHVREINHGSQSMCNDVLVRPLVCNSSHLTHNQNVKAAWLWKQICPLAGWRGCNKAVLRP